jgi:hypothetical protein
MAKSIYIADPAVAAAYHVAQGEWASVPDDEADWLVVNRHAYTLDRPAGLPAAGFVNPLAPLPFVPYSGGEIGPGPSPPDPPAGRRVLRRAPPPKDADE